MSAVRSTRAKADPTIEQSWLEYPDGIPVEAWGKDHNSMILYAETRAVDHRGKLSATDPHMRVDRRYPTRLHNGVEVHGHTDFDCLADAQAAGFLTWDEGEQIVRFTDDGWTYVHGLRRKIAETGRSS
jgi:hypothetical protein